MSEGTELRLCRWCGRLTVPERARTGTECAYVCGTCRKRGATEQLAPPPRTCVAHPAHPAHSTRTH
ncbi:hypothetical protein [Streptomyces sp. NPDC054784]